MKPSSKKAKGRRLQQDIRDSLRQKYCASELVYQNIEPLVDDDIQSIGMGQAGPDIVLSPRAKERIPFDIECKAQESVRIWKALSQAEANCQKKRIPLVVMRRNRGIAYACLKFEDLLRIVD
jgi:hypothetical protein